MVLTITQFVEAIFIALMLILLTNPHLMSAFSKSSEVLSFFHWF